LAPVCPGFHQELGGQTANVRRGCEKSHPGETGESLLEQLEPLLRQVHGDEGRASGVSAWASEAVDEPRGDSIDRAQHNDRNLARRILGGLDRGSQGDDDIDLRCLQGRSRVGGAGRHLLRHNGGSTAEVLSLCIPEFLQSFPKCRKSNYLVSGGMRREETYPVGPAMLLHLGHEWREHHDREAADERATVDHWMISSVRSSTDWGIVSPRAFAVVDRVEGWRKAP
jgi:hypothetical protein